MERVKYAYRQVFAVSRFLISYHGAVDVGNNCLGVSDIALQLRNDDMGVGNDGVRVCDITADIGHDGLGI